MAQSGPATRYVQYGDSYIAYQVFGEGSLDLVFVPGIAPNLEHVWDDPSLASLLRRLGQSFRVVVLDTRGTGLSDPLPGLPTLHDAVIDILAVMDTVEMTQAVIFGYSLCGTVALLFAGEHPERTRALILFSAFPRLLDAPDYSWGWSSRHYDHFFKSLRPGKLEMDWFERAWPSMAGNERHRQWFEQAWRTGPTPGRAEEMVRMYGVADLRPILSEIQAPTLVFARTGDQFVDPESSRYMAAAIPRARLVELRGRDHFPWLGGTEPMLDEIERFIGLDSKPGKRRRRDDLGAGSLTRREREVLELVYHGCDAKEIAARLYISERTVESHVAHAYVKLGVRSRVELVRRASEFDLSD